MSRRTAAKWRARWRSEGDAGLLDRSSAPTRVPGRTGADRVRSIELLRRLRMTAAEIAEVLGMALSTVSAILKRIRLGKRSNERARSAISFLRRALAFFAARGVACERVLTDNGSAYLAHAYGLACVAHGLRHTRTRPRRPRTNGKAERFIQTLPNEWAYARLYATSVERAEALPLWLNHYNYRRPHGGLGHRPPGSRLNNVSRNYT